MTNTNDTNAANTGDTMRPTDEEIINKQVKKWRNEIADLQDKVDFATGKPDVTSTAEVMCVEVLLCQAKHAFRFNPKYSEYSEDSVICEFIEEFYTTLLAPHLAKIKELEADLAECGKLLIDSNNLLKDVLLAEDSHPEMASEIRAHLCTSPTLESQITELKEQLAKAEGRNKTLKEALEFYADEGNYIKKISHHGYGGTATTHSVISDNGRIANQALSETPLEFIRWVDTASSEGEIHER